MIERNGGSMDELISREKAIDIVQGYAEQLQGYIGMPNDSEVFAYARGLLLSIDRNIKTLPSAQPEIIRCKDCKHHGTNGYRLNCAVFCCTMPDDGFCSCGERREDG